MSLRHKEVMLCVHSILLPSTAQQSVSTGCFPCSKENRLTIRGEKRTEEKTGDVLYQGIAARTFERSFQLADYVEVKGASLLNGLLHVDLARELPEAMKPRAIPIASSSKLLEVKPANVAA
jgi:molecular chaperone IbpA